MKEASQVRLLSTRPARQASGFTLIEVLVALLVLSLGLLGLAAMQAQGLRFNQSAYLRSQATYMAYDIIDRMRANREAAINGDYDWAMGTEPDSNQTCNSTCTPAQLADFDLNTWQCTLGNWNDDTECQNLGITGVLPGGQGAIERNGNEFTVTIRWNDRDDNVQDLSINTEI
ncbi:type IV pilus modification protein PilV [Ectothiorhodospiraceae bacterium WFHF3C12]|nr:type IV pilus modification protein PilV [Ectothiorhodospiraceae bacterium WFHF3C12]